MRVSFLIQQSVWSSAGLRFGVFNPTFASSLRSRSTTSAIRRGLIRSGSDQRPGFERRDSRERPSARPRVSYLDSKKGEREPSSRRVPRFTRHHDEDGVSPDLRRNPHSSVEFRDRQDGPSTYGKPGRPTDVRRISSREYDPRSDVPSRYAKSGRPTDERRGPSREYGPRSDVPSRYAKSERPMNERRVSYRHDDAGGKARRPDRFHRPDVESRGRPGARFSSINRRQRDERSEHDNSLTPRRRRREAWRKENLSQDVNARSSGEETRDEVEDTSDEVEIEDEHAMYDDSRDRRPVKDSRPRNIPISIPYTAADSEFLYGHSVVFAALKANKRQNRKVYILPRAVKRLSRLYPALEEWARRHVPAGCVKYVDDEFLPVMDKIADNRPHNGIIMEASPLPKWTVSALGAATDPHQHPTSGSQSFQLVNVEEADRLTYDNAPAALPYASDGWRHPFVLLIDDVLDPGNLGAIVRSAYFLGIDALAIVTNTCAPFSNVALKTSAGAAEGMTILSIDDARRFLHESHANGWTVYAGVTPEAHELKRKAGKRRPPEPSDPTDAMPSHPTDATPSHHLTDAADSAANQPGTAGGQLRYYTVPDMMAIPAATHSPLYNYPTILVVGGEGAGVRRSLQMSAQFFVSINPAKQRSRVGVDSLNVSVASAILAAEFLRRPIKLAQAASSASEGEGESEEEGSFSSELGF